MTSEAGSRPLSARLAPSGSPRERATTSDSAPPKRSGADGADASTNGPSRGRRRGAAPEPTERTQKDALAALVDEAQAAVAEGANALRDVRERYRAGYLDRLERWDRTRSRPGDEPGSGMGATDEAITGREVGQERLTLGRIDLAARSLENAWLFLAKEDSSLVSDPSSPASAADAQMRIVEAQEAERSRLAREVHDGPAQALANAIFQVEIVQRLLDRDERLARAELQQLRDVLTRELRSVRAYLSQLRPPLLADLGLSGAIREAADQVGAALGIPVYIELEGGMDALPETVEIVTLRVVQEALQNTRKHARASSIRIRMGRDEGNWIVEVRDDGRGFDANDPPTGDRRNFGLQFMRERAELIGARFEVRSSPNLGTAVRMTIPPGAMGMPIPGEGS